MAESQRQFERSDNNGKVSLGRWLVRRSKSHVDTQGKLDAHTAAIKARKSAVSANGVAYNDLIIAGGLSENPTTLREIQAAKHQNCHARKATPTDHPPTLLLAACAFSKTVRTDSETPYTALRTP